MCTFTTNGYSNHLFNVPMFVISGVWKVFAIAGVRYICTHFYTENGSEHTKNVRYNGEFAIAEFDINEVY